MNRNPTQANLVYCVDLAKNKFQCHSFSSSGQVLQRATLTRARFDAYFADPKRPRGTVVMEACASSHYWARRLEALGYQVKLVPAQFVAKQRIGNKTDGNDADAIYAVHCDPRVRPVPVKSLEQQDLCAEHRVRELLVSQRTQLINQARGLLAERGCVAPRGEKAFDELLRNLCVRDGSQVTEPLLVLVRQIADQIGSIDAQVDQIERRLGLIAVTSPVAQLVDSIFAVGTVTSTAFAGEYGLNVDRFADSRQFAASIGVTPKENSSGETRRLGSITKRGNPYLRKLLVQCAQVVLMYCQRRDDAICLLARRLLLTRPRNTVVIAIANRLARTIYAVIKHREPYRPQPFVSA